MAAWPRREAERGAERAGRGGSRGCGCDPAAAIHVPYAGAVGAAVAAPPECVEASREAIPAPVLMRRHRCMRAISRTYRTLYSHISL